jgi:hypothetical protein
VRQIRLHDSPLRLNARSHHRGSLGDDLLSSSEPRARRPRPPRASRTRLERPRAPWARKRRGWAQPANEGFEREEIIGLLDGLQAKGHDYEVIDGDSISNEKRQDLYGEAFSALAHAGNRYRIRKVFGSRLHGGGDALGTNVPALIVFDN